MARLARTIPPVALVLALGLLVADWRLRPAAAPAIGRPFPRLALAALPGTPVLTDATLRGGHPTLVNFFASWCVPCRAEAPALAALRARGVAVAGIAVRDRAADAAAFVAAAGAPYAAAGVDPRGRVQAALASDGIPETWLVDGGGTVRARYRGNVTLGAVPLITADAERLP